MVLREINVSKRGAGAVRGRAADDSHEAEVLEDGAKD